MYTRKNVSRMFAALLITILAISICIPAFATADTGTIPYLNDISYAHVKNAGRKTARALDPDVLAKGEKAQKETVTYILGDVNLDNELNTGDATLTLRYYSDIVPFTDLQKLIGDANKSGTVNTGDVTMILRMCLELEPKDHIEIQIPDPEYTITYLGGMEGQTIDVPASAKVAVGTEYAVSSTVPACTGYEFSGWTADFDGNLYTAGQTFTMPAKDVTLTATWKEPVGTAFSVVVFDCFNETTVTTLTMYLQESVTLTNADIKIPEGYKFYRDTASYQITVGNNGCYPSQLKVETYPYAMLDGSQYIVLSTADGVDNIRLQPTWNFILKTDIDMEPCGNFTPIGWTQAEQEGFSFTGILEGDGHQIYNLRCDYWDVSPYVARYVGLIASNAGYIRNLKVFTATYEQNTASYGVFGYQFVGIICGANEGTVENCLAQGNVGSSDCDNMGNNPQTGTCGGITGENAGRIYRCGSNVGAEGFYYIGGLVGKNFGTIDECWFAGAINTSTGDEVINGYGIRYIGGLCGGASATINNCYTILMDYICAYGAIGGLIGQGFGCSVNNVYVAFSSKIYSTTGQYVNWLIGFPSTAQPPTYTNAYSFDSTQSLPATFSDTIWDMNGYCFTDLPDLIYARRPEDE